MTNSADPDQLAELFGKAEHIRFSRASVEILSPSSTVWRNIANTFI